MHVLRYQRRDWQHFQSSGCNWIQPMCTCPSVRDCAVCLCVQVWSGHIQGPSQPETAVHTHAGPREGTSGFPAHTEPVQRASPSQISALHLSMNLRNNRTSWTSLSVFLCCVSSVCAPFKCHFTWHLCHLIHISPHHQCLFNSNIKVKVSYSFLKNDKKSRHDGLSVYRVNIRDVWREHFLCSVLKDQEMAVSECWESVTGNPALSVWS